MNYKQITDYEDKKQAAELAVQVVNTLLRQGAYSHITHIIEQLVIDLEQNEVNDWACEFEIIANHLQIADEMRSK